MNAKIMKAAFVAAIAVVASYGVYANLKADNMSDLMLANVEGGGVVKGIKFFSPCP